MIAENSFSRSHPDCLHTLTLTHLSDANGNTEVVKTGMGSSAALATSLVGALLVWFGVVRLGAGSKNIAEDRRVLHNLAQLAHAVAQGKIGSGFDVAAAVYGTQIYKRFSPEVLSFYRPFHYSFSLISL